MCYVVYDGKEMRCMPDLDDFYAFNSTNSGRGSVGPGCLGPSIIWILILSAIVGLIGKLFEL